MTDEMVDIKSFGGIFMDVFEVFSVYRWDLFFGSFAGIL